MEHLDKIFWAVALAVLCVAFYVCKDDMAEARAKAEKARCTSVRG